MNNLVSAFQEFLGQPFGAVGALCIMSAVTVINSKRLQSMFPIGGLTVDRLFNALNLVGGITLLVNAVWRDEVVWTVLETYFIAVAVKGIVQSLTSDDTVDWTRTVTVDLGPTCQKLPRQRIYAAVD